MSLVCPVFWSSFLVLWASQGASGCNTQDVCLEENGLEEISVTSSSSPDETLLKTDVNETFTCLLYPTNLLNCSWSFHNLPEDTQLSVCISICDDVIGVDSLSSVERVGSTSLTLQQHEALLVKLKFNMSRHDEWKVYTYTYEKPRLEVLSPPVNVSATVQDGRLLVTWNPSSQASSYCSEYQLDLGDKDIHEPLTHQTSFTKMTADPTHTYRVRMRTRIHKMCFGSDQWSEWTPTITVEQSVYKLNTLLIVSISLGIPMILLAVMLLVRHQRVSELLFPPITRPPPKYIYFLEKSDPLSFFHPALPPKAEEEITEVQDAEYNPGKTL
ncbi:uncharacterized protein AKAME5_002545000 [Lates japonicus]|uniref:Fibronectin type-III domain-containing protein n=1 Tax=Lates japonicus TaxID=270547 RepID=A0AAD3NLH6_LATJO|nr:uncharacterized protein AKAME5_002545000 [Lates japonicus]